MATFDVIPHNLFSQDYKIMLYDEQVADIKSKWLESGGQITHAGHTYKLYREPKSGAFLLEEQDQILARAKKNFTPSFDISSNSTHYTLTAKMRERTCTLQQGTEIVGSTDPKRSWSRSFTASFPEELTRPVQLFVIWLAVLLRHPDEVPTTGTTA